MELQHGEGLEHTPKRDKKLYSLLLSMMRGRTSVGKVTIYRAKKES